MNKQTIKEKVLENFRGNAFNKDHIDKAIDLTYEETKQDFLEFLRNFKYRDASQQRVIDNKIKELEEKDEK